MPRKYKAYFNDSCRVGWSYPFTFTELVRDNLQVMMNLDDDGSDYEYIDCALVIVRCEEGE